MSNPTLKLGDLAALMALELRRGVADAQLVAPPGLVVTSVRLTVGDVALEPPPGDPGGVDAPGGGFNLELGLEADGEPSGGGVPRTTLLDRLGHLDVAALEDVGARRGKQLAAAGFATVAALASASVDALQPLRGALGPRRVLGLWTRARLLDVRAPAAAGLSTYAGVVGPLVGRSPAQLRRVAGLSQLSLGAAEELADTLALLSLVLDDARLDRLRLADIG